MAHPRDQLERKIVDLWRKALWLIVLLAVWAAAASFENLPLLWSAIPAAVVVVMVLFALFVFRKRSEILEHDDVTHLRESEARFTELSETLQEGIFVRNAEGTLLDVNPAMVRMLGYSSKYELLDVPWQAITEGESGEIKVRCKDGAMLACQATSTPLYNPTGEVVRYQGTLIDVSQKKEMEERLHHEQEFARRLVACFPDMISALDRDGRYTFVSPRSQEVLGYTPDEMMGGQFGSMIRPEDLPRVREAFADLINARKSSVTLEYGGHHRDGSKRAVTTSACPLSDASGHIIGVVASTRDLTEHRRLEQQIAQSEKLAAMGRMIAGVAHELNNPLTVILGASDLSGATQGDPTTRRHFELIHQQARRTADIVQNLLSFSRSPSPERKTLDLDDIVRRALQLGEYSLRLNGIATDIVASDVSSGRLPPVTGDAAQLIQVFLNLMTNAEQAIREVRERGTIRIRAGSGEGNVWVSFEDDGPGIDPAVLPNIFDPFFTTKRPGRGTGLGLSICLSIIREHGGTIEAQPAREGGAVLIVTLPEARDASPRELKDRDILVVDDEPGILDLVRITLQTRGMRVTCCSSVGEALQMLAATKFDFILSDMKMPGGTGKEFYEALLARDGKVPPFVLMAGDPGEDITMEFTRQAKIPLVSKPFTIAELMQALEKPR
jgi:PAS domain S-box-containing protein